MGWVHDTGYAPAYAHEGWTAAVLDDGSDDEVAAGSWPAPPGRVVTGWRAACECGWRGPLWPRAEWPSEDGWPPAAVEGGEPGGQGGCCGQWRIHLAQALPELAVHDTARRLEEDRAELDAAVIGARSMGASWERIGGAAVMSRQSAHERWGDLVTSALAPVRLDGEPQSEPLDAFGAVVVRRAQLARRRHGGHPSRAWSTTERVAVALVLHDHRYLQEMGFSLTGARARIEADTSSPPRDVAAWINRIRAELNAAQAPAAHQ